MTKDLRTFSVLFLCAHNSARSILAETLLNRLGAGRFNVISAGFDPAAELSPYALSLLEKINYRPDGIEPKSIADILGANDPGFDFVIRLSPDRRGGQRPPQFVGSPIIVDWYLPDPCDTVSRFGGSPAAITAAYADLFSLLAARLDAFANLSTEALMGQHIQARLDRMGEETMRLAS